MLSFPAGTRMIRFPAFPLYKEPSWRWDNPFRDLWIEDHLRLPTAYRSLSRPSSALEPSHSLYGLMCIYTKSLFQTYDGSSCIILFLLSYTFTVIPVVLQAWYVSFWLWIGAVFVWTLRDSNARPLPCKGSVLPTELRARWVNMMPLFFGHWCLLPMAEYLGFISDVVKNWCFV